MVKFLALSPLVLLANAAPENFFPPVEVSFNTETTFEGSAADPATDSVRVQQLHTLNTEEKTCELTLLYA